MYLYQYSALLHRVIDYVYAWHHLESGFCIAEQQTRGQFLPRKAGQTEHIKIEKAKHKI